MCLWFECFGLHKHDDVPSSMGGAGAKTTPHDRSTQEAQSNGYPQQGAHYYGNQYGHPQQGAHHGNGVTRASPNQTKAGAGAEAGHKASNDARRGPAAHAVAKDAAFAYTTAAAAGTLKPQPAWNNNGRVAEGAGHGAAQAQQQHHYYYKREPVHREAAAMDHRYSTATTATTADYGRY